MTATKKTWTQLMQDLSRTMRLWPAINDYQVFCVLQPREMRKIYHSPLERKVTLELWHRRGKVVLHMQREERAVSNLSALCQLAETLRMNEVRKLDEVIRNVYRTWYPQTPQRPQEAAGIPRHYQVLGVLPSAPMAVVEAAYKALVKTNHPDIGGSTEVMQGFNAAMDTVRKERAA